MRLFSIFGIELLAQTQQAGKKARWLCFTCITGWQGVVGLNLPGWCWAGIMQLALIRSSGSLHSEVRKAVGVPSGVAHSIISVRDVVRPR